MMRLEDVIVRLLPEGGLIHDRRPEEIRGQLSFSVDTHITIQAGGDPADAQSAVLVITTPEQLQERSPVGGWTVVTDFAPTTQSPLPDVLAWASQVGGQLADATAVLSPRCTALVVAHAETATAPIQPAEPGTTGDDATWKRLAGELIAERFRNSVLAEQNDRLSDALEKEKAQTSAVRQRVRRLRSRLDQVTQQPSQSRTQALVSRIRTGSKESSE